ncbi:MAG: histidine kinase/response regulator [Rhodospirillales bacterium]|jgi:two-component system cell cycle sensor histidine kinase/response regulator CckA|nr:histidine kinase/response regulator [Rhodospirillales bacterium]
MRAGTTVLTVDDDDDVRMLVADILGDAGFRVLTAASGEAALGLLQGDEAIDVLFTDVVMPGLSGMELARRAKRLRPTLRILVASGYWPHIVSGLRADERLSKPYDAPVLVSSLRRLLASAPTTG